MIAFFIMFTLAMMVCAYFSLMGLALLVGGFALDDKATSVVGAIVLACAVTAGYNVAQIPPFSVTIDTHVYQEHK